jgi:hypothetical protein
MRVFTRQFLIALALLALSVGSSQAATVNVSSSPGSLFTTDALTGFSTTGAQMHGMEVTTCFAGGGCETITWDGTVGSSSYGEAVGTGWSLSVAGDTFTSPFTFTTTGAVTSISVNGRPGNTIFDIIDCLGDGIVGCSSPGSARGMPFGLSGANPDLTDYIVNVQYTDQLAVGGVFYGDLFTVMNVDFNGDSFTGSFQFISDTDNSAFNSPIVPVTPVPEPAPLLLMAAGLIALSLRRRIVRH